MTADRQTELIKGLAEQLTCMLADSHDIYTNLKDAGLSDDKILELGYVECEQYMTKRQQWYAYSEHRNAVLYTKMCDLIRTMIMDGAWEDDAWIECLMDRITYDLDDAGLIACVPYTEHGRMCYEIGQCKNSRCPFKGGNDAEL